MYYASILLGMAKKYAVKSPLSLYNRHIICIALSYALLFTTETLLLLCCICDTPLCKYTINLFK